MKKLIAMLLAMAMLFSLAACGNQAEESQQGENSILSTTHWIPCQMVQPLNLISTCIMYLMKIMLSLDFAATRIKCHLVLK